ncbi:hypothetical protein [Qipengyuania nanhaisediminis]|uniref:hypothetical protein n=1 Tax=Qipengyuania nanhaisediminis TaxID=604088 RepID=UPI0038B3BBC4
MPHNIANPHRPARPAAARAAFLVCLALALSACASQVPLAVEQGQSVPGFWWGLWHGFVFPWAFIGSLFSPDIAVYAVPNTGGWYDFGFFLGVTVLGGGSFFGSKGRRR